MATAAAEAPSPAQFTSDPLGSAGLYFEDPLGFVDFIFPWGVDGTRLENETGPDEWQADVLDTIGRQIRESDIDVQEAIQLAVSSGHGIGKSALIAWILIWFIATRPEPQIVVTANTKAQLDGKTWREVKKWHRLMLPALRELFQWTATRFFLKARRETWFAAAIPWSEHNSEAFAGTHEKHVLILFDEASAIADVIWEVCEGAMTTPGAMWICFGNPTKNTGRFRECFSRFKHRWIRRQIDSRTAKMADLKKLQQWVDDYGEDSDFVRVRVRGVFPRAGTNQLIASDLVEYARHNEAEYYDQAPKVLGVDVAREGDDQSVIVLRQGPKVHWLRKYRIGDLMQVASLVAEAQREVQADAIFVDGTGMGAGVVDRLRQLNYKPVAVMVGHKAHDEEKYYNQRTEIWVRMRDWLREGDADIPRDDIELHDDLIGPEYGFDNRERLQLEKKQDMKERGLASPDCGDALALTFTHPVVVGRKRVNRNKPSARRRHSWRV